MKCYTVLARRGDMTEDEWRKLRKTGIGGSDAAGIVGLSEYDTPITVWADKTGKTPDVPDSEAMRFGRDMESYIASRFAEVSGLNVTTDDRVLQSAEHPFMTANIDRWAHTDIGDALAGLEIKGTSPYNRDKYAEGAFPLRFYVQCVHYMAVTGAESWYLAVYLYGTELLVYQMTRDINLVSEPAPDWIVKRVYVSDEEIDALVTTEKEFWEHVKTDTIPPVTGAEADTKFLCDAFSEDENDDMPVDLSHMAHEFTDREELKDAISRMDTEVSAIDNRIKREMEGATVGLLDGWRVTWKSPKNGGTRRFRITKTTNKEDL